MKLNSKTISRLALPAGKTDHIIFDEDLPSFGIRLRGGGKITWIIQYRVGSKQRRVTLGTVKLGDSGTLNAEEARKAARDRLAQVQLGGDPQKVKHEARAKAATTLGAVVDTYLSRKEPELRVKTLDGTLRYLRQHWKSLHGLPIHEITRRDVAIGLGEISTERGLVAAARARAALSALFAWAVREGIAEANPVVGTNRPAEPKARDRVLSDAELAEIWAASRDDDFGRIVRLLVLVGARREEIGGLTWNETDTAAACLPFREPGRRTVGRTQSRWRRSLSRSSRQRRDAKGTITCLAKTDSQAGVRRRPRSILALRPRNRCSRGDCTIYGEPFQLACTSSACRRTSSRPC